MSTTRRRLKSEDEKLAGLLNDHAADRVFAFCQSHAFGDFINELIYATTIAKMMNDAELTILYPNDRPYRKFLSQLVDERVTVIGLPAEQRVPLNWFGISETEPGICEYPWWYERLIHLPNLFLTPSMMIKPRLLKDHLRLKFPAHLEDETKTALIARGVDPDRWIVTMHLREGGYRDRAGENERNVDVNDYLPLINEIHNQGGQVVRVGDNSCTTMGSVSGLVEIMNDDQDLPLQCYAFSRSRFSLCTDSGPSTIAFALKIPTLITNACGFGGRRPYDMLLMKSMRMQDGRVLDTRQQIEFEKAAGIEHPIVPIYLTREWAEDDRYINNTPEQLMAALNAMIKFTQDCPGWRTDYPGEDPEPKRRILWPPEVSGFSAQILDV